MERRLCSSRLLPAWMPWLWLVLLLLPQAGTALAKNSPLPPAPDSVVITYNVGNPPFKFTDRQGRPAGILIDLWRLWSQKTGVDVLFKEALFSETLTMLKTGQADIHAGLFYSRDRDDYLDYSAPLSGLSYYVFHHNKLPGPLDTLAALTPYRIGVPRGYTRDFVQRRLPGAALGIYDNFPALYDAALAGKILVFVSPALNLEYHLRMRRISSTPFRYNPARPVYTRVYHGAVAEGNDTLLTLINQGLARISQEERMTIERKWLRTVRGSTTTSVIIACDSDRAPLTMLNAQGKPAGLLVDLWRIWGKRQGIEVEFLFDHRRGAIDAVRDGLADFHSGLAPWPGLDLTASIPFYQLRARVFVPLARKPQTLMAMRGHLLAALDKNLRDRLRKRLPPPGQVIMVRNYTDLFTRIAAKEVDGFVDDEIVARNLLLRQGRQGEFTTLSDFHLLTPLVAVTRPGHTALLKQINTGLKKITPSQIARLERKWFSDPDLGISNTATKEDDGCALGPEQRSDHVELTKEEKDFLHQHPEIRVGYDPEFFPFEFKDKEGKYSGIAADYLDLLARRLGFSLRIVDGLSWTQAIESIQKGEIDLLPCVGKTMDRREFLSFSDPYVSFQRVVITRSDFPFIQDLDDLRRFRVAVQANSSHAGFLREQTPLRPLFYPTQADALMAVSKKQADAFIGNLSSATYWIRTLHLTNLKVAAPAQQEKQNLHIGIRADWPILTRIINKGLASISTEEENRLLRSWVSVEYEPGLNPALLRRYLLQAVGLFTVFLLGFLLWNRRLKQEVRQRQQAQSQLQHYAAELEKANQELKSLDRLKSMFIASMSHELRTPLNSIIGFTGVILQGMTGEINDRQRDQLGRVYRSAQHLLALISDVIDISKIEAGRIETFPQPFSLNELIKEAAAGIQPQLQQKNLTLSLDLPREINLVSDRKRVLQVLLNLLSNAVKYTEQGKIVVTAESRGDQVEIAVTDTGIGIARKDLPHLFEAFERLDSHLRIKAGGAGLGLYLTRKIVTEMLAGEIRVESEPGRGSTFTLTISTDIREKGVREEETSNAGSGD